MLQNFLFSCSSCETRYSISQEKIRGKELKIRCKTCSSIIALKDRSHRQQKEKTSIRNLVPARSSPPSLVMPFFFSTSWLKNEAMDVVQGRKIKENKVHMTILKLMNHYTSWFVLFFVIVPSAVLICTAPFLQGGSVPEVIKFAVCTVLGIGFVPMHIAFCDLVDRKKLLNDGPREYRGASIVEQLNQYGQVISTWNRAVEDERMNYRRIPDRLRGLGESLSQMKPIARNLQKQAVYLLTPRAKEEDRHVGLEKLPDTLGQTESLFCDLVNDNESAHVDLEDMEIILDAYDELQRFLSEKHPD